MEAFFVLIQKYGPQIVTLGAVIGLFWRFMISPLYRGLRAVEKLLGLLEAFPEPKKFAEGFATLETQMKDVQAELKENGGGSLRDAIKRIESENGRQTEKLKVIGEKVDSAAVAASTAAGLAQTAMKVASDTARSAVSMVRKSGPAVIPPLRPGG